VIHDSWAIACHLEDVYTDRPSLFGGENGRALARFINLWSTNFFIFRESVVLKHLIADPQAARGARGRWLAKADSKVGKDSTKIEIDASLYCRHVRKIRQ
jgi:hypothetical protein